MVRTDGSGFWSGVLRDAPAGALGRKHRIKKFRDLGGACRSGWLPLREWFRIVAPRRGGAPRSRKRIGEAWHQQFAEDFRFCDPAALDLIQLLEAGIGERIRPRGLAMRAHSLDERGGLELASLRSVALLAEQADPPDKP